MFFRGVERMADIKRRVKKLEEEVSPKKVTKIKIVSHIPGLPSQTITIPATKEAQHCFGGRDNDKV